VLEVVMSVLNPVAEKLGKLLRLLGSDRDGETLAAAKGIVRVLEGAGLDVHVLADEISGNGNGKFSEADAQEIYRRGLEDGRRQAEEEQRGFRSVDALDEPTWHEIARECAARNDRLNEKEPVFVADMVSWTACGGAPTEKQAKWLRSIYARVRR
jgi:hypothetical protein